MAGALRRRFQTEPQDVTPESECTLLARTKDIPTLALLPDTEQLFVFERFSTEARLFSISSGECLRTYSFDRGFFVVIPLDLNVFACGFYSVSVRRISDGSRSGRFNLTNGVVTALASLEGGRFLVGTSRGEVLELQWCDNDTLKHNSSVAASLQGIMDISVSGNRFAIFSYYGSVTVFEADSFKRVVARHPFRPNCIHFTEVILAVGTKTGIVYVYDTVTFDVVRKMRTQSTPVSSVHVVRYGRSILSCAANGSFNMHDVTTGGPLWRKKFNAEVVHTVPLSDGRLVTALRNRVIVHGIPQEEPELVVAPPTPLRDAFKKCISGAEVPAEQCEQLITPETCRASFHEWCCAHQLLMMAIEDGDIPKSPDFKGEISWWFENLYVVAKNVKMASDDDIRSMKRFLVQAKAVGVVEGIEPVLAALRVTQDLTTEVREIKRADILMLERVLQIEARLEMLRETFDRYRKYMRYSQLLGVALQVIPIAGGSVAGIVSVGAEVVEGLSAKDLTDYFLGFGSSMVLDEISDMGDRVFRSAAAAMSPEMLEKMNAEHRLKLEETVRRCDMSIIELRELFLQRAKNAQDVAGHVSTGAAAAALKETVDVVVDEPEEKVETHFLAIGVGEVDVDSAANIPRETSEEEKVSTVGGSTTGDPQPSSWIGFEFDRVEIKRLSQEELASLWAAFIVRNDEARQEEYEVLRDCLLSVLREEDMYSDLIIDNSSVPSEELVQLVVERMLENRVRVTMGVRGMMRQFLREIQRED